MTQPVIVPAPVIGTYNVAAVLASEEEEIGKQCAQSGRGLDKDFALDDKNSAVPDRVGMAFSGGGIRSACIGLGVVQALSKMGMLSQIHYMSGISGGGYLVGWLAAWIKREEKGGVLKVEQKLASTVTAASAGAYSRFLEPDALHYLRRYSSYLTPRVGFLSGDTLAMAAIYLRNLLLNQILLAAATFSAMFAIQQGLSRITQQLWCESNRGTILWILVPMIICFLGALGFCGWALRDLSTEPPRNEWKHAAGTSLVFGIASAALAWALIPLLSLWKEHYGYIIGVIVGMGLLVALVPAIASRQISVTRHSGARGFLFLLACAGSSAVTFAVVLGLCNWVRDCPTLWTTGSFFVLGLPAILWTVVAISFVFIGLAGDALADSQREWISRQIGYWLFLGGAIAVVLSISQWGPGWFEWLIKMLGAPSLWKRCLTALLPGGWIFVLITGVLGGKSAKTGAPAEASQSNRLLEFVIVMAPPIFLAGVLIVISWTVQLTVGLWCPWVVFLVALIIAGTLGVTLDVNEFSMHLFYRNRLVRAFLGASNSKRKPSPFTGFAKNDDMALKELTAENGYFGPYPIWGTTLNLTRVQELAWQERKGASFIYSPLFCGWDHVDQHNKPPKPELAEAVPDADKAHQPFGFRSTQGYDRVGGALKPVFERTEADIPGYGGSGGAPYIGTAMAASGAAASPNMGYHTRPGVAALMTIFNVRLGWWTGNPRHRSAWKKYAPSTSYLLKELFSQTDDSSRYVYLSDGGHFENLGLYELVRRRVRFIICSDGDADKSFSFGDLGNAVDRCRRDFGVEITIKAQHDLRLGATSPFRQAHYGIGEICYPGQEDKGILLYIKSSLTDDEPADVLSFQAQNNDFPHDTTVNQFFSETRFEAYRGLGEHMMSSILNMNGIQVQKGAPQTRIAGLFKRLKTVAAAANTAQGASC